MRKTAMTLAALAIGGLMSTSASAGALSSVASAGVKQGLANSNVEQVHKKRRAGSTTATGTSPADTATMATVIPATGAGTNTITALMTGALAVAW